MISEYIDLFMKMEKLRNDWGFSTIYHFLYEKATIFAKIHDFSETGYEVGEAQNCYGNSADLAITQNKVEYCEGIAVAKNVPLPLAHAWCYTAGLGVIDPTWENRGVEYFGVVIPKWYVFKLATERGYWGVLDAYDLKWPILTGAHKWPLEREQVKKAGWKFSA